MKRWMLGLLAVLFSATLAAAQQQPPPRDAATLATSRKLWPSTTRACWGIISISLAIRPIWASGQ